MARRRFVALLLAGAASLTSIGTVTAGHSLGLPVLGQAYSFDQALGGAAIYHPVVGGLVTNPAANGLVVVVFSPFCATQVKLKTGDFTITPGLTKASVKKSTPCGFVSLRWTGVGPLRTIPGNPTSVVRSAKMTGTIGSTYLSVPSSEGYLYYQVP